MVLLGKYRLEEGVEVKITPGNIGAEENRVISIRTEGGDWIPLSLVSFFTLVDAFQETESHKYGPKSDESYPHFFFRDQLEYLAKGKCLDPEEFPGELEDEIREHMDKINKIMKEFEEKIGIERVRVEKEFILSSSAGEIQYEEGDIIRVPKELAEERDELIPYLSALEEGSPKQRSG